MPHKDALTLAAEIDDEAERLLAEVQFLRKLAALLRGLGAS